MQLSNILPFPTQIQPGSKNQEPRPHRCKHCGASLPYRYMNYPELRRSFWASPKPCACPGAIAEAEAEADRLRVIAEKEAEQRRVTERARLLKKSGLPARYHSATFETAEITDANRDAYAMVMQFAANPAGGLLLSGPVGTGKTFAAACVVNAYLDRLKWATFGNVLSHLGRLKRSYSEAAQEEEWRILDELNKVPLLVIDDLGKEKVSEWVEQVLYQVIDGRYRDGRSLILTTNFDPDKLGERYPEVGPAMISRIAEMCEPVFLGGEDRRLSWMRS